MDCEEPVLNGHQYGKRVKCALCHSSYRFCRDNVENWGGLSQADRKRWILTNKGKGGRGKKRQLEQVSEARPAVVCKVWRAALADQSCRLP